MIASILGIEEGFRREEIVSISLRAAGLYSLDVWWKTFLPETASVPNSLEWYRIYFSVRSILVVLQTLFVLFLPLRDLVSLYIHYLSFALMLNTDTFSCTYALENEISPDDPYYNITRSIFAGILDETFQFMFLRVSALAFHITSAIVMSCLLSIESFSGKAILAVYAIPMISRLADFSEEQIFILHNCARVITIMTALYFYLKLLPELFRQGCRAWNYVLLMTNDIGFFNTVLDTWAEHNMTSHFIVFWIAVFLKQLWEYLFVQLPSPLESYQWYLVIFHAFVETCSTPLSLVATCVMVSWVSSSVIHLTQCYVYGDLQTANGIQAIIGAEDDLLNGGMGEGITFAVLAAQTGLIQISMPQRVGAMYIIMFIVVGSLVQSVYETAEPGLLALAASHSRSVSKHARALSLIVLLLLAPIFMAAALNKLFDSSDFWTMVVISTCALTSVQVLGTLFVYSLFAYDAIYLEGRECWDGLDDIVYCAKAFTRCLEFTVAVFVVAAGIRETVLGKFSWLNAIVLIVHCYCNVWHRLQLGWQAFLVRRGAVRKVASLPDATPDELREYDDVCAICYMEMSRSAKRTFCNHFFHSSCLRKWLYIQDKCPLCSARVCQVNVPANNYDDDDVDDDEDDYVDEINGVYLQADIDGEYDQPANGGFAGTGIVIINQLPPAYAEY